MEMNLKFHWSPQDVGGARTRRHAKERLDRELNKPKRWKVATLRVKPSKSFDLRQTWSYRVGVACWVLIEYFLTKP